MPSPWPACGTICPRARAAASTGCPPRSHGRAVRAVTELLFNEIQLVDADLAGRLAPLLRAFTS